jgi:hypothetical protein
MGMAARIVVVCVGCWVGIVRGAETGGGFWNTERPHTIHIRVTQQSWQMMQPVRVKQGMLERLRASQMGPPPAQPSTRPVLGGQVEKPAEDYRAGERLEPNFYGMQFAYVKADFECDGVVMKDVGARLRGNSSYTGTASGLKRPFKIDFNRFVEGQKFQGLAGFYLNNNAYDPSMLRETMGYEAFGELGVPAPRTSFAMVYLTIDGQIQREYLGLYTVLEEISAKVYLKDRFGSAKGMLLKPWSIQGLPYLGEEWRAYASRYNVQSGLSEKGARRTIEFIKLVNYADDAAFGREIGNYLDVDGFLRLLAGHVVLSNLDNFLYTGHNFYMYLSPKDERFHLLPWDLNLAFANYTSAASVEQLLHLSILHPHAGEMKLIDRLLAIPRYKEVYFQHIQRFLGGYFNPQRLFPRIDALQAVVAGAEKTADEVWAARHRPVSTQPTSQPVKIPPRPRTLVMAGWQGQTAIGLKEFVTRRTESLKAQLAGQTEGYTFGQRRFPSPPARGLRAGASFGNLSMLAMGVMNGADGDYDAKLTAGEIEAAIRWFYGTIEAGRQGALSESQIAAVLGPALQRVEQRGGRGERQRVAMPKEAPAVWAAAIMGAGDAGQTGRLGLNDALAAARRAMVDVDKDKSGKLDVDEVLRLLDGIAGSMPPPATQPATNPTTRPAR